MYVCLWDFDINHDVHTCKVVCWRAGFSAVPGVFLAHIRYTACFGHLCLKRAMRSICRVAMADWLLRFPNIRSWVRVLHMPLGSSKPVTRGLRVQTMVWVAFLYTETAIHRRACLCLLSGEIATTLITPAHVHFSSFGKLNHLRK